VRRIAVRRRMFGSKHSEMLRSIDRIEVCRKRRRWRRRNGSRR